MIIISHRGYWKEPAEKNQPVAFHRSFDLGFGTETDLRDNTGQLVIAHDMPRGDEPTLDQMLDILGPRDLPLAAQAVLDAGCALVVDHFGRPASAPASSDEGFAWLLDAAACGRVWVKLSAAYRNWPVATEAVAARDAVGRVGHLGVL